MVGLVHHPHSVDKPPPKKNKEKLSYPSFCTQRFQIRGEMTQRDWYDSPKTLNLNKKKRKLPQKIDMSHKRKYPKEIASNFHFLIMTTAPSPLKRYEPQFTGMHTP